MRSLDDAECFQLEVVMVPNGYENYEPIITIVD